MKFPPLIKSLVLLSCLTTTAQSGSSCATIPTSTLSLATHNATPFCHQPYSDTLWIPSKLQSNQRNASTDISTLLRLDASAKTMYNKMLSVLAAYDCSKSYSYHTCDQCRDFYKTWICLMTMPTCASTAATSKSISISSVEKRRPCLSTCNNVLRACTYNLKFSCPKATSLFPHDYSTDVATCDFGRTWDK
jgi:hypothetical protein